MNILQDLRYSLRALTRAPGFALAAILTLAVSIMANTAVFSVLSAVLLNPRSLQHAHDPARLVTLTESMPALGDFFADHFSPRARTAATWTQNLHSVQDLGVLRLTPSTARNATTGSTRKVSTAAVTPQFLSLLGIQPETGRTLTASDTHKPVAIITNALYHSLYQSDPSLFSHDITLDNRGVRVVGVLPASFELPSSWAGSQTLSPDVFIPLAEDLASAKDQGFDLTVYARLRPGYTVAQAQAELDTMAARLRKNDPGNYQGIYAKVRPILDETVDHDTQHALLVLQIAVCFVLLIACANVGNLLLTRAIARDKEVAVRIALGAGRWPIIRQILVETCLISLTAGALGTAATFAVLRLISSMVPDVQGFHEIRVDVPVLLFALASSLGCGLLFALPAIWRSSEVGVNQTLNRTSRSVSTSSTRLRTGLAIAQVALSLVLLVGAGLLLRSLQALLNLDLGYDRAHLVSVLAHLPESRYHQPDRIAAFDSHLLTLASAVPGLDAIATSNVVPMRAILVNSFEIPGRPTKSGQPQPAANYAVTSAGYFEALRLPLLHGRTYTPDEVTASAPVAVINQRAAKRFWPGEDALGKILRFGSPARDLRVIGIVGDEAQAGPDHEPAAELYMPGFQGSDLYLVARTHTRPAPYAASLVSLVKRLDPSTNPRAETADESLNGWLTPRRFNMTVISCFAAVAVLLASVGLYSLLAYSITLRHREIGIRLAIGADAASITRMILRNAILIAIAGISIGLASAFFLTRFLSSLIFGVTPSDPLTFLTVTLLLAALSLLAGYAPARRAARIDPIEALRQE